MSSRLLAIVGNQLIVRVDGLILGWVHGVIALGSRRGTDRERGCFFETWFSHLPWYHSMALCGLPFYCFGQRAYLPIYPSTRAGSGQWAAEPLALLLVGESSSGGIWFPTPMIGNDSVRGPPLTHPHIRVPITLRHVRMMPSWNTHSPACGRLEGSKILNVRSEKWEMMVVHEIKISIDMEKSYARGVEQPTNWEFEQHKMEALSCMNISIFI